MNVGEEMEVSRVTGLCPQQMKNEVSSQFCEEN